MYVLPQHIARWEKQYGSPVDWSHHQVVDADEFAIISGSQKNGHAHDITLYIEHEGRIAVIAKPFYPPTLYRAPSGGLNPGESLEDGAAREAIEETGLAIRLSRYLLRASVRFTGGKRSIDWLSHVFSAVTDDTDINPTDTHEIRECRWADPGEFADFCTLMRQTRSGGLAYRAALHEHLAPLHPLFFF